MCDQCGKILDLMQSQSFAVEEDNHLKSYYFCSEEHMKQFAERKSMKLGKD
jgi:YHS domain-containing protein